jgi:L-ribulokinase
VVWRLCGVETRSACTAGYKAIFYQDGHFPSREFLGNLHPELADVVDAEMKREVLPLGSTAGHLTEEAAGWTSLLPLRPALPCRRIRPLLRDITQLCHL